MKKSNIYAEIVQLRADVGKIKSLPIFQQPAAALSLFDTMAAIIEQIIEKIEAAEGEGGLSV